MDKVLGRISRLDAENVRPPPPPRHSPRRSLLETVFNIVEDGIVVLARPDGRVQYLNQSALLCSGLADVEQALRP